MFLVRSREWGRMNRHIVTNEGSDQASLSPLRPWHDAYVVGVLCRHVAAVSVRPTREAEIHERGSPRRFTACSAAHWRIGGGGRGQCFAQVCGGRVGCNSTAPPHAGCRGGVA